MRGGIAGASWLLVVHAAGMSYTKNEGSLSKEIFDEAVMAAL